MLHTKHAFDNIIQNVLVVIEETDVIAFLLKNLDLRNGRLFQRRESQNFQRFADIKQLQLQSGLSSNITGLRLIETEIVFKSEQFQRRFQMLGETLIVSEEVNEICEEFLCQLYGSKHQSVSDLHYHFRVLNKWKYNHIYYLEAIQWGNLLLFRASFSFLGGWRIHF